jgi:GNAT superfamily N-acetyltransferase
MTVIERSRHTDHRFGATLRSGVDIVLRPLVPSDAVDFHHDFIGLSTGLLGLQLFPEAPRSDDHDLNYLTSCDFETYGAWVALTVGGSGNKAVGIGRWICESSSLSAVAAVALDEDWRYQGIGDTLLALVVQSVTDSGAKLLRVPVWVSAAILRPPLLRLGATFGNWSGGRSEGELQLPANADALADLESRVGLRRVS